MLGRVLVMLVVVLPLSAGGLLLTAGRSGPVSEAIRDAGARAPGALPVGAWAPVSAALGRDDPAYRVQGLSARNPAQDLSLRFTPAGVVIGVDGATARLGLWGVGPASAVVRVRPAEPLALAQRDRVSYARGPVREWYVNGPLGLEQGFDVLRRPAGRGPVRLAIAVSDAAVRLDGRGGAVITLISLAGRRCTTAGCRRSMPGGGRCRRG